MATTAVDNQIIDMPLGDAIGQEFEYPGIPTTCDGAEAIVWVETRISQGSGAYPITSSTTMGGGFNQAVSNGVPNLWGDQLVFIEPESEHSAASFCEGFAAGGRAGYQLHVRPGVGADEGGALHDLRQAPARGLQHRGPRPDEPIVECPRRPRRRDERGRLRLGDPLRPQRPGDLRPLPGRPPRRGSLEDPVPQRPGRLPDDPHDRDRAAAGAGVHEGVRGSSGGAAGQPDGPGQPVDVRRRAEPGFVHEGQDRPAVVLRAGRARPPRGVRRVPAQDRPPL